MKKPRKVSWQKPQLRHVIMNNLLVGAGKGRKGHGDIIFIDKNNRVTLKDLLLVKLEDFDAQLPTIITSVRQMVRAKKAKARKEAKCRAKK